MDYRNMINQLLDEASEVQLRRVFHFLRAYLRE